MEEDMDAYTTEMDVNGGEEEEIGGNGRVPILRPEELPEHCNLPSNLPTCGMKEVYPDGSQRQHHKLQKLYNQQDKLLQEERVVKVNRIAIGEWNHSKQLVEVKVEKGKFWQTMGYNANGKKYLYPEEGLFLLEMNIMELRHGKVPLSVQQAYELMIPFQFSLEHYQVYCHLMRLGYITTRHKESDITDYEYRINLDQFRHRQKQAYKKVQGWFQQMNETTNVSQQDVIVSDSGSGRDVKSNKSGGSMSFHGSGVSGKAVEGGSTASSINAQLLPGSGVSTDSSADNDDASSVYSDGPVSPKKQSVGSDGPSVNLLEFHRKHVSDNSVVSSTNKKSSVNNGLKVKPVTTDAIKTVKESRKRKLVESKKESSKTDEASSEPKRKMVAMEIAGQVVTHEVHVIDQSDKFPMEPKDVQDVVMKKVAAEQKDSVKIYGKIEKNPKDDSGKDSESRRSSDGSDKDYARKTKETVCSVDVIMESISDHSQDRSDCGKATENQVKSCRTKSSDLGTDLSLSPSSIDIDDVLGMLSPSSPRNDSILDDGHKGCKYTPWNFQQICLPNLAEEKGRKLGLPLPEYLPQSIASAVKAEDKKKADTEEESAVQVAQTDILVELKKVSELLKTSSELMESTSMMLSMKSKETGSEKKENVPTIGPENIENVRRLFPTKPTASNWGEYKRLTSSVDQLTGITDLIQSPVAHLWQEEVQPLVRPSDAVSTSYLLHKLQIIHSANLTSQHVRWPYVTNDSEDCRIAFDVYQPDTGYKKSKPGLPHFKVVVSSVKDPVPNLATQAYLLRQASPVRLLWAVVDTNGDVAFYSLQDVEVPVDIMVGW